MSGPAPAPRERGNRLTREKSPYLLQHAYNPIDWYPWGQEAFDEAESSGKPIFLSIGYATCHWCHVMARESFESAAIATFLNEHFVSVKVDREERPDIDSLYMEFAQALMGSSGGWPLNLILSPSLKPLVAFTYLPPEQTKQLIGLKQLLESIHQVWTGDEKEQLLEQGEHLLDVFRKAMQIKGEDVPGDVEMHAATEALFESIDPIHGGMKGAPKFPMSYQLEFFLLLAKQKQEGRALFCAELTLDMMSRGGIYDHLGGGFSRYTIDEFWHIPHFEKMLYDNALLAKSYVEAWKYLKKDSYKQVAQETLNYVLREMTSPEGAFYCAQDADVDGQEGATYTWTWDEVAKVVPADVLPVFASFYGISPEGNFEGKNILHIEKTIEEVAHEHQLPVDQVAPKLDIGKKALFAAREKRPRPFKDDKILCAWNGLMIESFCLAGSAFQNELYTQHAIKAAEWAQANLWKEGKFYRRYRDGEARFDGGLDDYAFMIRAALSLFTAGQGAKWLEWAIQMSESVTAQFKMEGGGFYTTPSSVQILVRKPDFYDGSEPSGEAVHAENLLRLHQLTLNGRYLEEAEGVLQRAASHMAMMPPGSCYHLLALARMLDKKKATIVIVLDEARTLEKEIAAALMTQFIPHTQVIWKRPGDLLIEKVIPWTGDKTLAAGKTTVYICHQDHCKEPLVDQTAILAALQGEM
jgi:uncharacterized protein YyaL (SSP411 family)